MIWTNITREELEAELDALAYKSIQTILPSANKTILSLKVQSTIQNYCEELIRKIIPTQEIENFKNGE